MRVGREKGVWANNTVPIRQIKIENKCSNLKKKMTIIKVELGKILKKSYLYVSFCEQECPCKGKNIVERKPCMWARGLLSWQ